MTKPILIVDDAQNSLAELASIIAAKGYQAMVVPANAVAVVHFAEQKPELVFVSLGLPEPLVICEGIRSDPDGAIVPIILIGSNHAEVNSPADALNQGADYYFSLPIDDTKVIAKIATYIGPGEAFAQEVIKLSVTGAIAGATAGESNESTINNINAPQIEASVLNNAPISAPTEADPPLSGVITQSELAVTSNLPKIVSDDLASTAKASLKMSNAADALLAVIAEKEADFLRSDDNSEATNYDVEAARRAENEAWRRTEQELRLDTSLPTPQNYDEARRQAEAQARRRIEEEARRQAEQDARQQAEAQARRRVEEDARRRVEEEARRRIEEEARRQAEEDARHKAEEDARMRVEAESRERIDDDIRKKIEEETRLRLEQEMHSRIEEETRKHIEVETRRKLEQELRHRTQSMESKEAEIRRQVELELRREMGLPAPAENTVTSSQLDTTFAANHDPAKPEVRPVKDVAKAAGIIAADPSEGLIESTNDIAMLMYSFYTQKISGRVDFTSQSRQKTVFFEKGIPVDAYSSQVYDRIEEYLLREGRITRAQYQDVRVKSLRGPRRVAAYLASEGYLKPDELFVAVRGHLQETLYGLFEWEEGEYHYFVERVAPEDKVALDSDPRVIIAEGVRRKYLLPRMMTRVGGPSSIVVVRGNKADLESLNLASEELSVVRLLDGTRSLEDAIFSSGIEALRVYHAVVILVTMSLAEVTVRGIEGISKDGASGADAIDRARISDKLEQVRNDDYFKILGVTRSATTFEIDRAYERISGEFQPQRFSSKIQEDMYDELFEIEQVLREARQVLRDEKVRERYDKHIPI
ncbi:MAG: DnaJ domain-containing protein [Deltaproteobacteria bacterium]|nr:DnaJ domain-containing protein [Deltaproteobacteria bacterium]